MDQAIEYANSVLSEFDTHIPIRADRTVDGAVEILGLGFLCIGTDDALSNALAELGEVDQSLDPDDLRDGIADTILRHFDF